MEAFTNPSPTERKFLVPFEVGSDKVLLYGGPIVMSSKSELIKSLLEKLDFKEPNSLAPDMKIDPKILMFLWDRLNGINTSFSSLSVDDLFNLWPLMNYFDINTKSEILSEYLKTVNNLLPTIIHKYPSYESSLMDILGKVKLIDPQTYRAIMDYFNLIESRKVQMPLLALNKSGPRHYGYIDSTDIDKALIWLRLKIEIKDGKKIIKIPKAYNLSGDRLYYTYPEYDQTQDAYVIYPLS